MTEPLWARSATELAHMIATKTVSSSEVVSAHLDRIAAVNPSINAVTLTLGATALADAAVADAAVARGDALGPLHGVPFTIKENLDVIGSATTNGVVALEHAVVNVDAPVVARMRAAGAIPLARTNMPDMGLRVHTDSSLRGLTRNPWNRAHTTAGSSGGEGAALAAGLTPIGLGNDIGGSLRNPAHCCGVASLKPTQYTVPGASSLPPEDPTLAAQLMLMDGPMARHVEDLRLAYGIIPPGPLHGQSGSPSRVAVLAAPAGIEVHADVSAAIRDAARMLAAAGYEVDEIDAVPGASIPDVTACWRDVLISEVAAMTPLLETIMGEGGMTFLGHTIAGHTRREQQLPTMVHMRRRELARRWSAFFVDHPIVLAPVWTQPAPKHGFDIESDTAANWVLDQLISCVTPGNLLGIPGAVVPVGMSGDLPIGVQVYGARLHDGAVLAAAASIETGVRAAGRTFGPIDPRG
jgi:amidase